MKILIAEDEYAMQKIIGTYLIREGYRVSYADNGEEALVKIYDAYFDLVILDWMMPQKSGIEVCREVRERNLDLKILMLTAKSDVEDELAGLEFGANDYMKKPFDPRLLVARVKKLLGGQAILKHAHFTFNVATGYVVVDGEEILLSNLEQRLLRYFMENKGIILSRERILNYVWGMAYEGDDRTVDTHIRRLRKKIGEESLITYRGLGYRLGEGHE